MSVELSDDCEADEHRNDSLSEGTETVDELKDRISGRSRDVFNYIFARAEAFGDTYPFEISPNGRLLIPRAARPDRLVYLFMLSGSLLRYVPDLSTRTKIAAQFEWLSLAALRSEMPERAEVRLFGANSSKTGHYSGLLSDKIRKLATDLRVDTRTKFDEDFEAGNRGDNGLDLVAWTPPHDIAFGMMTVFGQCACTPSWVEKQQSSNANRWGQVLQFDVTPINYCFIPFDFRKPDGNWYARQTIHGSVLLDRRRILAALGDINEEGEFDDAEDFLAEIDLDMIQQGFYGANPGDDKTEAA